MHTENYSTIVFNTFGGKHQCMILSQLRYNLLVQGLITLALISQYLGRTMYAYNILSLQQ